MGTERRGILKEENEPADYLKRCHSVGFKAGFIRIKFNPVVTLVSALIIWGFVTYCVIEEDDALTEMKKWKAWITDKWTWFYIGTQDVWAVFIVVLYFSKYSNVKLGKDDEKIEFNNASYFTMLFAAGMGIGLFYFGVAETIYHYSGRNYGNRIWARYTDNQRAQDALNLTFFHWGIHAWIVYIVVGLLLAFLTYRKGLPMTMRSCFYPLLGNKVFGFLGDLIDILSVVCTMFGVCTSLGLGVIQLNAGFHRINSDIMENVTNQIILIWCITAIATASVISGIKLGIRRLSEFCFVIGMFIMLVVFFADNTWYILNLYVQSIGYYLQYIVQIGFHTDAFAQLSNAPDGYQAPEWMDAWTIFYWGWWIAWSPFVGIFIAKISRGRTIKQFINATLTAPILYTFMWLTIFGGAGLRMERDAELKGIKCDSPFGGKLSNKSADGLWRLSCRSTNDMWFDTVEQYGDIGQFLSVMSLLGIVLYFVTSSDSGSLVIDCLSANGESEPPIIQRIFWALTEGACATALLKAGGKNALEALQTASITAGLPYTVLLNFMCVALWRAVKEDAGDLDRSGPSFTFGLFSRPTVSRFVYFLFALVCPWYPMGKAAGKLNGSSPIGHMIILAVPFYTWIILMIVELEVSGLSYVGWAILFGFFAYGTGIRIGIREKFSIDSNLYEDFFAVMLMYPIAAVQMADHMENAQEITTTPDPEIGLTNLAVIPNSKEQDPPLHGETSACHDNWKLTIKSSKL